MLGKREKKQYEKDMAVYKEKRAEQLRKELNELECEINHSV